MLRTDGMDLDRKECLQLSVAQSCSMMTEPHHPENRDNRDRAQQNRR